MERQLNSGKLAAGMKMLIAFTAIFLAAAACTTKKKELTSKVDPTAFVRKADFQKGTYRFSRAIEEADSNNSVEAIPGFQMDLGLVTVEITETELRLVSAFDPTNRKETASVLSSFPIKSHFDIVNEQNDYKENTNKIIEDSTTNPWNQRQFMRVDWAHPSNKLGSILAQVYGSSNIIEENTVIKEEPKIDTDGHISFLIETGINDHNSSKFLPPFGEDLVSAYRVTYRTHLTPVVKNDFKPVPYSMKDFGRFGFFVTQQNYENPEKGFLDQDLKIYAHVFNVCEAGRAESCATAKIKWVLTKDFPAKYLPEARQVVAQWNKTFQDALNRTDDIVVLDESFQVDLGDNRFNTIAHYEPKANGGLLGVAQSVVDPRTGETISARATVYEDGIRYEQGMIDNLIDLISSDDPLSQVIGTEAFGPVARLMQPFAADNQTAMRTQHKLMGLERQMGSNVSRPGINEVANIVGIRSGRDMNASGRAIPSYLRGNAISKTALTTVMTARPDLLRIPELDLLSQDAAADKSEGTITERLAKVAEHLRAEKKGLLRQSAMGVHGSDLVEDAVVRFLAKQVATAGNLKVLSTNREEIKAKVAKLIFYTTLLHEMGHTFGLRHNFKGSADRANYYPEWQELKKRLDAGDKDVTKEDLAPYAYSSIMDYGADFFSQAGGLGPYDKAAIKYGYNRSVDRDRDTSFYVSDQNKNIVLVHQKSGKIVKPGDDMADAVGQPKYYFCTDHQVGEDILCRRFDRGSTVTEITEHAIERYNANWAMSHFRRGRTTFDESSGNLADRLITGTMLPVRQVMDEFVYSMITKAPSTQDDAGCRFRFMEDSIRNGDMANICDADQAKAAGVDLGDMTTWANALYGKDRLPLKKNSGDMKPYGLADLLRANEVAQRFFADVIGSIEPGFYLALPQKDPSAPRVLTLLDKDLARLDIADAQAKQPVQNRALVKFAKSNSDVKDADQFVKDNVGNLVRIDVGRYGRPYMSQHQEEGTMRTLQNVGNLSDKIAAIFALSLRDIGINKYQDLSMTGNPYDYPQSKLFTVNLFTKMLNEDLKISQMDVTLADGTAVKATSQGVLDFNAQRLAIILAMTQFVNDTDPSAVQKLRICISGESQCGNSLSGIVAEALNSTGAFTYRAVQTLDGDSIAYAMVAKMKALSDKRAPLIEKSLNPKKFIADVSAKISGTADLRARLSANLDKVPALSSIKPLIVDPAAGAEAQGITLVMNALSTANDDDGDTFLAAAAPGVIAIRDSVGLVVAEIKKMGNAGVCAEGNNAAQADCAKSDAAAARALLIQIGRDLQELTGVLRDGVLEVPKIKQAKSDVKDVSDSLASEEVKVELMRNLMNVLGWR